MFEGVYTALVTPFTQGDEVDFDALGRLVETQIEAGVSGLVPVGTTGESPTLSMKEHQQVIEHVVKTANKRVKIIAGTGGNATAEALELTAHAKEVGADATLQVTPYYNKPSQAGLMKHFTAIADVGLPVVLYNIPGRTGTELALDTVVELASHPNIAAIKEASGNVDRISQYVTSCDLEALSGDDMLTLPMMVVGAVGVISVAANVVPKYVSVMVNSALNGCWEEARGLHIKLHGLFSDLFIDTNPVPVKAALAMMQQIEETYRLPLCPLKDWQKEKLRETLTTLQLL